MTSGANTPVTLAILAGGEGSRMGKPKGLLRVNDRPILGFLLDRLAWSGPTLLITAPGREHPPGCARFTRECVDPVAGQGPLRGVLTALETAPTSFVLVLAIDMPMIEAPHLEQLIDRMSARQGALGLMPARSVDGRPQIEPFPGIFHIEAIPIVRRRLDSSLRSVVRLVAENEGFFAIDMNWDDSTWLNLNQPSDLPILAQHGLRIQ